MVRVLERGYRGGTLRFEVAWHGYKGRLVKSASVVATRRTIGKEESRDAVTALGYPGEEATDIRFGSDRPARYVIGSKPKTDEEVRALLKGK